MVLRIPDDSQCLQRTNNRICTTIANFKNLYYLSRYFIGKPSSMGELVPACGQNLSLHPHVHCIVPNGGLTKEGKWQFLFPMQAMKSVFKAFF